MARSAFPFSRTIATSILGLLLLGTAFSAADFL